MEKKLAVSYLILALVVVSVLLPFGWLILSSVDPAPTLSTKMPETLTLANFAKVFSSDPLRWILNSLFICISTATIVLLICVFGAYPFSRFKFRGSDAILWTFLILRVFPTSGFIVPLYILFAHFGLINSYLGLIIACVVLQLPAPILIMKGFYDTVPISYEESAWVDGHERWRALLGVLLPICAPGMAVAWFLTFLSTWGMFLVPLIFLRSPSMWPLSVGIFTAWGRFGVVDYGLVSALSILYLLPPLVIYLFGRRWLVRGMAGLTLR